MWLAETWVILWYCAATEREEDKQNVAPKLVPQVSSTASQNTSISQSHLTYQITPTLDGTG